MEIHHERDNNKPLMMEEINVDDGLKYLGKLSNSIEMLV